MKTYIAHIIYRISCAGVTAEQYEEQWRLVLAEDYNAALRSARKIANEEECMFVDRHGRTVSWQLVAIKDLQETELAQGSLLISSVKEVQPIADPLWTK